MAVGADRNAGSRGLKLRTGLVADDDADVRRLRSEVGHCHGQHYVIGVVIGHQVRTGVAGFERNHGFLRAGYQVENGEAIDSSAGE